MHIQLFSIYRPQKFAKKKMQKKDLIFLISHLIFIAGNDIFIYSVHHNFPLFIIRFIFYSFIYFVISSLRAQRIFKTVLLMIFYVIDVAESSSYYTTERSFSNQYFSSIESFHAIVVDPQIRSIFFAAVITFIAVFAFTYFTIIYIKISNSEKYFIYTALSILLYIYIMNIKKDLYPFDNNIIMKNDEKDFVRKVDTYFNEKMSAKFKNPKKKPKNLIIVIIESFELKNLGRYNVEYPGLMPYITNLAGNSTIFTNNTQEPFTQWSVASFVCTMCGIPLLRDRGKNSIFHHNKNIKCVSDYLDQLGYNNYMIYPGHSDLGQLLSFAKNHSFKVIDDSYHNSKKDSDVIKWTIQDFIPNVLAKEKNPFCFIWFTIETHFGKIHNECWRDNPENYNKFFNAMMCTDIFIEQLFNAFKQYNLYDDAEVLIWGDHLSMGKNYIQGDRPLAFIVPSHKFGEVKHPTSYYDIAPLILDLLGVEYYPPFMFGSNPMKPNYVRFKPLTFHLTYLYKHFQEEMHFKNITKKNFLRSEDH